MCSSHLPKAINRNNMGGVSKNVLGLPLACCIIAATSTSTEYEYAITVVITISTSMFAILCLIAAHAWM